MKTYDIKLIEKIIEYENVYTFKFEKIDIEWEEGTNVHLTFKDDFEKALVDKNYMRHFSIMNLVEEDFIGFTTRITDFASDFKKKLKALKIGDTVVIYKLSQRMPLRRENRPILLLTMGVGVTAVKPMMETFELMTDQIPSMIHLNISQGPCVFESLLQSMKKVNHVLTHHRRDFYEQLDKVLTQNHLVYIVGSDGFIEDLVLTLLKKGLTTEDIMMDKKQDKIDRILKQAVSQL